nr:DUF3105 domain-containing protein [Pseudonocardia thermophila]
MWIAYDPARLSAADVAALATLVEGKPYMIISPYPQPQHAPRAERLLRHPEPLLRPGRPAAVPAAARAERDRRRDDRGGVGLSCDVRGIRWTASGIGRRRNPAGRPGPGRLVLGPAGPGCVTKPPPWARGS